MIAKSTERKKAIALRKQGLSYREILEQTSVAKSTLSLWLRNVGLSARQYQRLTEKKRLAGLRGSQARHTQRVERTEMIKTLARKEIGKISKRELWLIGTALYWAEGSKEKPYGHAHRVDFCNSDPYMIQVFLKWLSDACGITEGKLTYTIHIHENNGYRIGEVKDYWHKYTKVQKSKFRIQFKKHKPKTNRKNIGNMYYGLLRVSVQASSDLNRKIAGWIDGIYQHCGVV